MASAAAEALLFHSSSWEAKGRFLRCLVDIDLSDSVGGRMANSDGDATEGLLQSYQSRFSKPIDRIVYKVHPYINGT
jgi:hypothetical protein